MLFEQEDSNLYVEPVIFAKMVVEHFKVQNSFVFAVVFYLSKTFLFVMKS